ncbi:MAG: deoxyribodipyrimidine photo-lyase [Chlamydiales bacterium]|jgi:deoxyribodipyrimidine photo-lyase
MSGWNIVWHYRDLRIEDNPALNAASKGKVLPIYIHSPKEEGRWTSGAASNWWLHHSLQELSRQYKELGSRLIIRTGPAMEVLEELASELSIEAIYFNHRYEPEIKRRDKQVISKFEAKGTSVYGFEGNYLVTPSEILNKSGKPYSVFTPFSKTAMELRLWRDPLPLPKLGAQLRIKSERIGNLELLPSLSWADSFSDQWSPGRYGAMKKLQDFKKAVDAYEELRNIPDLIGTSRLSPHLHFGEISPHEVWKAIEHNSKDRLPFLKQLLWREFGNYFLFQSPRATDFSWKRKFEDFPWEKNKQALVAWQKGMTGYPIVDAGMRELWQTGWMHNRARMIVGSFLVKDLFIHWIEGARWFWDTLVDANLANNTLGWQWIAGSGPDAAPYFRIFNPVLQGKKFDPEGSYIRRWVPELAHVPKKWIHSPWEALEKVPNYPEPIVNHSEARDKALASYQRIK